MKQNNFKLGNKACKSYLKTAGKGYEVCFNWAGKTVFVGNFVQRNEAIAWYAQMNREIRKFAQKFKGNHQLSATPWYQHFLSSHLNKCYFGFLDRVFVKHTKVHAQAFKKDLRRYNQWKAKTPRTSFAQSFYRKAA